MWLPLINLGRLLLTDNNKQGCSFKGIPKKNGNVVNENHTTKSEAEKKSSLRRTCESVVIRP